VNLVLFEPGEVDAFGTVSVVGVRAAHLLNVLKVTPGSPVRCGVIDGPRGVATVRTVADDRVELVCAFDPGGAAVEDERPRVDVLLALPRPKVMRRLWAQLAAMGVGHIVLTNAERVERNYFDTHWLRPDTYRPLLIEGLQQARDTRLPSVSIHRQFRVLIEQDLDRLFPRTLRLVADPGADRPVSAVTAASLSHGDERRVVLAVGPEGGWNEFERHLLVAHGFHPVSMGSRTLRTDTAAVALLALVHDALNR
jgi:16S rRNA (uracil1498-N3)-methyltransferase